MFNLNKYISVTRTNPYLCTDSLFLLG